MGQNKDKSAYEQLGASASKAGVHAALKSAGMDESSSYFARLNADIAGDPNFMSFLHADGAGTKAIVAYLLFKETGNAEVFAGLAQDALVMNLDDVFCTGLPTGLLLSNAIARNARLITDDCIAAIIRRYKELVSELAAHGINIDLSGGETADMGDVVRTLVVDATLAGRIAKKNIVDCNNIIPGDAIVGLSSTGKANYEKVANSGMGSNGLTLARHALLAKTQLAEVCDPQIDAAVAYRGPFKVTDKPAGLGMSVGEALLSPTRTYAPVLKQVFEKLGSDVHGVIHATGGAMTKVLRFGQGNRYVKDNLFPIPALFQLIQEHGKVSAKEMYQVFNMGQRMELYVPATRAADVIAISKSFGIEARQIGRVEKSADEKNSVVVKSSQGEFTYSL